MGRLGQLEAGGAVVETAWALVKEAETSMTQTSRLMALAEAALAESQGSIADSALRAVAKTAAQIREPLTRASELSHLVGLLTASRRLKAAGRALGPAIEAAAGLEFEGSQVRILLGLARQAATIGAPAAAGAKALFEVAKRLGDPDRRSSLMLALARAFAVQRDFGRALEAAKAIENPVRRGDAMVAMADGAAEVGQSDRGLEIAAAIPNRDRRAMACAKVAARGGAIGPGGRKALTQMAKEAAP